MYIKWFDLHNEKIHISSIIGFNCKNEKKQASPAALKDLLKDFVDWVKISISK